MVPLHGCTSLPWASLGVLLTLRTSDTQNKREAVTSEDPPCDCSLMMRSLLLQPLDEKNKSKTVGRKVSFIYFPRNKALLMSNKGRDSYETGDGRSAKSYLAFSAL